MEKTEKTLMDDSDIFLKIKSVLDFLSGVCEILSEKNLKEKQEAENRINLEKDTIKNEEAIKVFGQNKSKDPLLTCAQVAKLTQLSNSTIRRYIMNKTIPYLKIGNSVRFRESDIEKWLSKKKR
jgi:excisionase family DNA binding protein